MGKIQYMYVRGSEQGWVVTSSVLAIPRLCILNVSKQAWHLGETHQRLFEWIHAEMRQHHDARECLDRKSLNISM